MSEPKLHHYVPQFHLRRFTSNEGNLWVWDKRADRIFPTTPGRIAAEKQFYRLTQYEADGHDAQAMEKQLSGLEGDVARITEQWLGWLNNMAPYEVLPIPTSNRKLVSLHLALQLLRTKDTREILASLIELETGQPVNDQDARELHTELMWNRDHVNQIARRFERSVWIFARNETATPLMTSDNPVAFRSGDNRRWLRAGIMTRGTYLVYPLSPRVVLYGHPREGSFRKLSKFANILSPVSLTEAMVEGDNSGQVFMASRFVISNQPTFVAERAFAGTIGTEIYAPPKAKALISL